MTDSFCCFRFPGLHSTKNLFKGIPPTQVSRHIQLLFLLYQGSTFTCKLTLFSFSDWANIFSLSWGLRPENNLLRWYQTLYWGLNFKACDRYTLLLWHTTVYFDENVQKRPWWETQMHSYAEDWLLKSVTPLPHHNAAHPQRQTSWKDYISCAKINTLFTCMRQQDL